MAKKVYVGIDGKARQVKQIYIGIGGLARKVKKAYVGVGGIARIFWSGGELAYYGTIGSPATAGECVGASVGTYALFLGGSNSADATAYSQSLTAISAPDSSRRGMGEGCGVSVGQYAIFGGGRDQTSIEATDAYDGSLVKSGTILPIVNMQMNAASTTIGSYGLIGGGAIYVDYAKESDRYVTVYDESLTRSYVLLSSPRYDCGAASVNEMAIFAGGTNNQGAKTTVADVFNLSLTGSTTELSVAMANFSAVSLPGHALFASGTGSNAFDGSLVRSVPASLSVLREDAVSLRLGEFGMFAGGCNESSAVFNQVDCYDSNLTLSALQPLSEQKRGMGAACVANYGLFAGGDLGFQSVSRKDTVEVYTI